MNERRSMVGTYRYTRYIYNKLQEQVICIKLVYSTLIYAKETKPIISDTSNASETSLTKRKGEYVQAGKNANVSL